MLLSNYNFWRCAFVHNIVSVVWSSIILIGGGPVDGGSTHISNFFLVYSLAPEPFLTTGTMSFAGDY